MSLSLSLDNYSMAALTEKLVVLAREGDEENLGRVFVQQFKSPDTKKVTQNDKPGLYVWRVSSIPYSRNFFKHIKQANLI